MGNKDMGGRRVRKSIPVSSVVLSDHGDPGQLLVKLTLDHHR